MKAFISYKWSTPQQNEWVAKLAHDLRDSGIDAHLDRWEVALGDSFTDYMTSRIADADCMLFIVTPESVEAVEGSGGKGGAVS